MLYFLVIGTNFGYPLKNIDRALASLSDFGTVEMTSSLHVTAPVDRKWQTEFANVGVKYRSDLDPEELIGKIKDIEKCMGRSFTQGKCHRRIDIDVASGDFSCSDLAITVPHPSLEERQFMLAPLSEIDPNFPGGKGGESFRVLLNRCIDQSEVVVI